MSTCDRVSERVLHLPRDVDQLRLAIGLQSDLVHSATILGLAVTEPLSQRQLDDLSADADRFIAELDEEAYLHFSGQKDAYELTPIYERHADLTTLETALRVGASVDGDRNARELWRFACEGYLGNFVREEAERARNDLTEEHLNPLHVRAAEVVHGETATLGAATYTDLYRVFGFPLDELAAQCRAFLESTERLWEEAGDRFFRARIGLGLGEAERWDVARIWRAPEWDSAFPADRMLPALEASLADLGVDLRAQRNVELDLADRPNKTPRAFCVPIEIPERVVLVMKPAGGPEDWAALFHEAGHTEN